MTHVMQKESTAMVVPSGTPSQEAEGDQPTRGDPARQKMEEAEQRKYPRFEALPSLSQKHDILRQLYVKLLGNRVLVLLGEAGSGKTTAAILMSQFVEAWCGGGFKGYIYFDGDDLPETVTTFPPYSLIVIDDFLGGHDANSLSRWNAVVPLLESMQDSADKEVMLLLTSRTAIFQKVLSSEEIDFKMFLDDNRVATITTDYRKMSEDICQDVDIKTSNFETLTPIGFPLCCQLAPHLAPDEQTILFQQPRLALHTMVRGLVDSNDIARTALTLLAVKKGSLNMNILRSLPQHEETSAQIITFYKGYAYIFQVCNDTVSFRSEVIREAVLVELCDSHAELLENYCSLELLSQIALATSDKDTSDQPEKPALPDNAKSVFLRRLIDEIKTADNYDVMFSPFFQHHSFVSMFDEIVKEEGLLEQWMPKCSGSGLHFVLYAGAVPSVFESAWSKLEKKDFWVVLQAILACCYWGYNSKIHELLEIWGKKYDLKKHLKEATIRDIVTGNLHGVSRREEPHWEQTHLFPEDTLLTLAARKGKDDVVKTLVNRGMNVNRQGRAGRTALMHCCARGRKDMVKTLLRKKADPMIRDKWGMTALMYALKQKPWAIPEELLTPESCSATNAYLQTPLTFACAHKWNTQMIETLIEKGADLLQKDKWGYTCLHYACLHGHTDIVACLQGQKEVDVGGRTPFGHTPLTLSVTGPGRSELVELLLQTGKTEPDIETLLMACRVSEIPVMETLLSALDPEAIVLKKLVFIEAPKYGDARMVQYLMCSVGNAKEKSHLNGDTALHSACIGASVDCCKLLLLQSRCNVQNKRGATPLLKALEFGALDCARLLVSRSAKLKPRCPVGTCIHHAAISNMCSALDLCIKELKMDVNDKNEFGATPLQVASWFGKYHSVKYLLDNGANVLNVDKCGSTCLHDAAVHGHRAIISLLLKKVVQSLMHTPNVKGETPDQLLETYSANTAEHLC